jgi:hypothetical protein
VLQAPSIQGVLDGQEDPVLLQGLLDKIVGTPADGLDGCGDRAEPGHDDHQGVQVLFPHPLQDVQAVPVRKLEVQEHEVRLRFRKSLKPLGGVPGQEDRISCFLQDFGKKGQDLGFVVYDENGEHRGQGFKGPRVQGVMGSRGQGFEGSRVRGFSL